MRCHTEGVGRRPQNQKFQDIDDLIVALHRGTAFPMPENLSWGQFQTGVQEQLCQSAGAIRNMAFGSSPEVDEIRLKFVEQGAVTPLVKMIKTSAGNQEKKLWPIHPRSTTAHPFPSSN